MKRHVSLSEYTNVIGRGDSGAGGGHQYYSDNFESSVGGDGLTPRDLAGFSPRSSGFVGHGGGVVYELLELGFDSLA